MCFLRWESVCKVKHRPYDFTKTLIGFQKNYWHKCGVKVQAVLLAIIFFHVLITTFFKQSYPKCIAQQQRKPLLTPVPSCHPWTLVWRTRTELQLEISKLWEEHLCLQDPTPSHRRRAESHQCLFCWDHEDLKTGITTQTPVYHADYHD